MSLDPRLIQESFALVEDRTDQVASHFYALLFLENPALRDLFPPMMDTSATGSWPPWPGSCIRRRSRRA